LFCFQSNAYSFLGLEIAWSIKAANKTQQQWSSSNKEAKNHFLPNFFTHKNSAIKRNS